MKNSPVHQMFDHVGIRRTPDAGKIADIKHICPETNKVIRVEELESMGDFIISKHYKPKGKKVLKTEFFQHVQMSTGATTINKLKKL